MIVVLELSNAATDMESNISEIKAMGKADKQNEAGFQVNLFIHKLCLVSSSEYIFIYIYIIFIFFSKS